MSQAGRYFAPLGPGEGVQTITGNSGGAVSPDIGGNINIVGTNVITVAGNTGTNTEVISLINGTNGQLLIGGGSAPVWNTLSSTGGTITITNSANHISLDVTSSSATTFAADSGSAMPSMGTITLHGGSNLSTSATGSTVTFNLINSPSVSGSLSAGTTITAGTGLTVTSGGITSTGTTTLSSLGSGVVQTNTSGVISSTKGTDGQLLIASGSTIPAWANITSGDGSITITNGSNTISLTAGSGLLTTLNADTGSATTLASAITVAGGSNISTSASSHTLTVNLVNSPSVSGSFMASLSITAGLNISSVSGNISTLSGNISSAAAISAGTSITGQSVTATTGNIITSVGNISSAGSVSSGTTVTAGTGISVTSGDIIVNAGNETLESILSNATGSNLNFIKTRSGGVITSGDTLGSITFSGNDNTSNIISSKIISVSSGTIATNRIASDLEFWTHSDSTTPSEQRMVISSAGNVIINTPDSGTALTINNGGFTATGIITLDSLSTGIMQTNSFGVVTSTEGVDGQILIGSSIAAPAWANITSSGGSIVVTNGHNSISLDISGGFATTYAGDTGTATPAAGTITLHGGSNIATSATGSTVTFNLVNSPSVSGSLTTGTGITATSGDIIVTAGNIDLVQTNGAGTEGIINVASVPYLSNYGTDLSNIFLGHNSGNTTNTASDCTGIGDEAFLSLTSGVRNTAVGSGSCTSLTVGDDNAGLGLSTLTQLTTGNQNLAIGTNALNSITSGAANIAIGYSAGTNLVTSNSNNIMIGNEGVSGDVNLMRIGTTGIHNKCFISGISGVAIGTSNPVLINSSGQLGTTVSSERYKDNIEDMGEESERIMNLRPVTFTYKGDVDKSIQYGLIAEEVLLQFNELVTFNDRGDVHGVRYHDLPVLLLNELKKQRSVIDNLEKKLKKLEKKMEDLCAS